LRISEIFLEEVLLLEFVSDMATVGQTRVQFPQITHRFLSRFHEEIKFRLLKLFWEKISMQSTGQFWEHKRQKMHLNPENLEKAKKCCFRFMKKLSLKFIATQSPNKILNKMAAIKIICRVLRALNRSSQLLKLVRRGIRSGLFFRELKYSYHKPILCEFLRVFGRI
jgi:hypothetical protein